MIEIKKKDECHGCHGCLNICPKSCISMEIDNEGFWYPKVNKSICINCNLCEKVCPIINSPKLDNNEINSYACKNKDENVRKESSSGGIFTLLCEDVINLDGVVFGAAYDSNFNVRHCYAESMDEISKFRGSKYVQSVIGKSYKEAKEFLDKGKVVLFSGTPCQISGLQSYLIKKYDNLILVDIACHGVPSPIVYRKYIDDIQNKNNSKIVDIQFREKSDGWKSYNFKISFENGTFMEKSGDNLYMRGYLQDLYLRPSCYNCKFKKPVTSADITLADYWGVQDIYPEFDDDKGVSLILVHTKKGKEIIDEISNKIDIIKTDYKHSIRCNPSIIMPSKYNKRKSEFFKSIEKNDICKSINKYTRETISEKIVRRSKGLVKKVLK